MSLFSVSYVVHSLSVVSGLSFRQCSACASIPHCAVSPVTVASCPEHVLRRTGALERLAHVLAPPCGTEHVSAPKTSTTMSSANTER
jgi:hypothetical protein